MTESTCSCPETLFQLFKNEQEEWGIAISDGAIILSERGDEAKKFCENLIKKMKTHDYRT